MVVTAKSNDRNILTAHMLVLVNTRLISDYASIVIIVGSVNCFQKGESHLLQILSQMQRVTLKALLKGKNTVKTL